MASTGGLRQLIAATFGESACLYKDVLQCQPKATSSELRKAYYKRAKCYHPDRQQMLSCCPDERNQSKDTSYFQAVSATYEFLCDSSNRSMYDSTGILDDAGVDSTHSTKANRKTNDEWREFFKAVFQEFVTADNGIDRKEFCGSDQEKKEVLQFYTICKGNLEKVVTCILLAENKDIPRWKETILIPHIQQGDVIDFGGLLETSPTIAEQKKKRKKGSKTDSQNYDSQNIKCASRRKKLKSRRGGRSRERQSKSVDNPTQASLLRPTASNVTKKVCSEDVLMDTDEEERVHVPENYIRTRIRREKTAKARPFESSDDEEENYRDEGTITNAKRKKTPTFAPPTKQQQAITNMSKRDKMEYRVAKMKKEKKLKEIQLAKLIKGKEWDNKATFPSKQRRHNTSFTNSFLSSLEKKILNGG